jgi:hypothetical protein
LSATQIATSLNQQIAGVASQDDGTGRLKINTVEDGTDAVIEFIGSIEILSILGFQAGQFDIGKAGRVPLVDSVTEYLFEDVAGTDDDYYEIDFFNSTTSHSSTRSDPVKGTTVATVAKQQADSRSPRGLTLLRKESHVFRETFFKDPACAVPLVPLDSSKYPSYQVIDINGQITSAGLATLDGTPGNYRVEVFITADAPISNDDRRWRIEWIFIDEDNRQYEKVTEFDVRDVDITASATRDQKLLAMACQPCRLYIRETKRPFSLRLDVTDQSGLNYLVKNAVFPGLNPQDLKITEVRDNETLVYYFDIPEGLLTPNMVYNAVWTIYESVGSAPQYAFQIIEVPPPTLLQFFPSLRMVIDKYQKRKETIQSYQDSDIYEYLKRGIEVVNSWHPLTNYFITNVPQPLVPYWLLAGQIWGLNAQHLLETDLQFSFGGQTVTLDYDHTGNLDTAIQRAVQFLTDHLTAAKTPLLRRSTATGVFAGKPYRYSGMHNFTFPMYRFGSADFVTLLSNFGLL